ncbi:MAG: peptide-methionine (R)-S-oxide reductase MsrB [Bacteroidales bacterium]|nr:peptide-methionine (R)-S-oxide reductase MsrB [Bacteroidales bacterium]
MKTFEIEKSETEWQKELNAESYKVLRQCGTEYPGTGKYYDFYEEGSYHCAGCGSVLFSSDTKYHSGSGWPSFYDVISGDQVILEEDTSLGMVRTEVKCATCGGHLGHVFSDGPKPTQLRYCINSASLKFMPAAKVR